MPKNIYDIRLKGYVGGDNFNSRKVQQKLDELKDRQVNVLIDSTGGSLFEALSIAEAFRRHGDVCVHFSGANASAATIASMGAKHITIDRHAMYLVHKGSIGFFDYGSKNADQLQELIDECRKTKADLDKIDLNIAAMYAGRCKKQVKDLLDLMTEGAWLNSDEALAWGFVDEITEYSEDSPARLTEVEAYALTAQGQPLPNLPVVSGGWATAFSKIESFLKKIFTQSNTPSIIMKKVFAYICGALSVTEIEFKDGAAQFNETELDKIENSCAEMQSKIESLTKENEKLKAEIEELKKGPAAESKKVIETSRQQSEKSDIEKYVDKVNAAKSLFNIVG